MNQKYDQAELKKNLPDVRGLDFEIHDEHTLMRIKTRDNGPEAIIRLAAMPADTIELIHIVRAAYFLELHPSCLGFTVTGKNCTYTRTIAQENIDIEEARRLLGMSSASEAPQFMEDLARAGSKLQGRAPALAKKTAPFEWGSAKDGSKRLRDDVVKKTANVFKQF